MILLFFASPYIIAFIIIEANELDKNATMKEFAETKGPDNFKYVSLKIKKDGIRGMHTVVIKFPYIPPEVYKRIASKKRYIIYNPFFYRQDKIVYKVDVIDKVKVGSQITDFCREVDNYLISQGNRH